MPVSYAPKYEVRPVKDPRNHPMVRDYMAKQLITIRDDTDIFDAVKIFLDKKISGAPVVDSSGQAVGMLSEKDCLRLIQNEAYYDHPSMSVLDYMSREIHGVNADADIFDAIGTFLNSSLRRLPVFDGEKLVGQISRRDCMKALYDMRK